MDDEKDKTETKTEHDEHRERIDAIEKHLGIGKHAPKKKTKEDLMYARHAK